MADESGASEHGLRAGLRTKTTQELQEPWQELFRRRRRWQPDDTRPLTDEKAKALKALVICEQAEQQLGASEHVREATLVLQSTHLTPLGCKRQ